MTLTVPPDTITDDDAGSSFFRTPPNDVDAERAVIGSMLIAKYAIDECADIVTSGEFYHPKHGVIFDAIVHLHWNQQPADAITVADHLERRGELSRVGGQAYLHQCVAAIPTAANGSYYASIVADKAVLRRLTEAGTRIAQLGYTEGGGSVDDLVGAAQSEVDNVARGQILDIEAVGAYVDEVVEETYDDRQFVTTPWPSVNKIIDGFEPSRVYTTAARPGGGKSIWMLQACLWMAQKHGRPAAISSMEMPRGEVVLRALALMSGVDYRKIKDGKSLSQFQRQQVTEAQGTLRRLPLFIDDRADQTVEMMRSFARQVKNRSGLGILGIDYVQLFNPSPGRKFGTRQEEVSHMSRQVKMTAKALEIPVIMLAQLNRVEGKPKLTNLRESGSLEQDSDVVVLLHREDDPETGEPLDDLWGLVAKNRSGPRDAFNLCFDGPRMRFTEHPDPIEGM